LIRRCTLQRNCDNTKINPGTDVFYVSVSCLLSKSLQPLLTFVSLVISSQYYFAESNANAALSYKKAIATLTGLEEEITEKNALSFSKGKTKLPGIGKGTAEKMKEFCRTGTFKKLEEKREAHK